MSKSGVKFLGVLCVLLVGQGLDAGTLRCKKCYSIYDEMLTLPGMLRKVAAKYDAQGHPMGHIAGAKWNDAWELGQYENKVAEACRKIEQGEGCVGGGASSKNKNDTNVTHPHDNIFEIFDMMDAY